MSKLMDAGRVAVPRLLIIVLAAASVALTPCSVASAGVRPPTCGTPNTPPCAAK